MSAQYAAAHATVDAAVAAAAAAFPKTIEETVHEKYREACAIARQAYTDEEAAYAAVCAANPERAIMVFVGMNSPREIAYNATLAEFKARKGAAAAKFNAASRTYSTMFWEYDAALKQAKSQDYLAKLKRDSERACEIASKTANYSWDLAYEEADKAIVALPATVDEKARKRIRHILGRLIQERAERQPKVGVLLHGLPAVHYGGWPSWSECEAWFAKGGPESGEPAPLPRTLAV